MKKVWAKVRFDKKSNAEKVIMEFFSNFNPESSIAIEGKEGVFEIAFDKNPPQKLIKTIVECDLVKLVYGGDFAEKEMPKEPECDEKEKEISKDLKYNGREKEILNESESDGREEEKKEESKNEVNKEKEKIEPDYNKAVIQLEKFAGNAKSFNEFIEIVAEYVNVGKRKELFKTLESIATEIATVTWKNLEEDLKKREIPFTTGDKLVISKQVSKAFNQCITIIPLFKEIKEYKSYTFSKITEQEEVEAVEGENLEQEEAETVEEENLEQEEAKAVEEENLEQKEAETVKEENLEQEEAKAVEEENLEQEEAEAVEEVNLEQKEAETVEEENLEQEEAEAVEEENLEQEEAETVAEEVLEQKEVGKDKSKELEGNASELDSKEDITEFKKILANIDKTKPIEDRVYYVLTAMNLKRQTVKDRELIQKMVNIAVKMDKISLDEIYEKANISENERIKARMVLSKFINDFVEKYQQGKKVKVLDFLLELKKEIV